MWRGCAYVRGGGGGWGKREKKNYEYHFHKGDTRNTLETTERQKMLVGLDEKMLVGLDEKKIDGLDEKELEAKKAWSRLGTRAKQVPVSQKTDNPQQKNE